MGWLLRQLGWEFVDLGKSLRWPPQPGVHRPCPLDLLPCTLQLDLNLNGGASQWLLMRPRGEQLDPEDPPSGAVLPRQLGLGAGVGTKQMHFKGQGPFSSDFFVF